MSFVYCLNKENKEKFYIFFISAILNNGTEKESVSLSKIWREKGIYDQDFKPFNEGIIALHATNMEWSYHIISNTKLNGHNSKM